MIKKIKNWFKNKKQKDIENQIQIEKNNEFDDIIIDQIKKIIHNEFHRYIDIEKLAEQYNINGPYPLKILINFEFFKTGRSEKATNHYLEEEVRQCLHQEEGYYYGTEIK